MKRVFQICFLLMVAFVLAGCLASTASPVGASCDYSKGKPWWELPVECQGK